MSDLPENIESVLLESFSVLDKATDRFMFIYVSITTPGHVVLYVGLTGVDLHDKLLLCRSLEREMNLHSEDDPTIYQCVLEGGELKDRKLDHSNGSVLYRHRPRGLIVE